LRSSNAEAIFLDLSRTAGDAGRLYALAGLHLLSSKGFPEAKALLVERLDSKVEVRSADEIGASSIRFLIQRIESGHLAESMAEAYKGEPPW
jgi:hypothetical protein